MSINVDELNALYARYGYKTKSISTEIKLFIYEQGRYFGVDIIQLVDSDAVLSECEKIRSDYAGSGYAAQVKKINSIEEAEIELYKSFFSYESTLRRLKLKYKNFANSLSRLNGGHKYNYITSPFQINNDPPNNGSNIILNVADLLVKPKPQLIIIEAAAGYGKTCTAYEILNELIESACCENPIITELSRNRGANIFRYILLDEIDREYPTLDSVLVKNEIQTGRIPLIIDGFDELLHKSDLIEDQKNEVFGEVEPMLDTIGNLLLKRAKIILTTRKTAIFSGSEFQNWFIKWENAFEVTRFSIEIPRIKDWLGDEKVIKIKEKEIPIEQIANPVLLTYLRNLTDPEFIDHINEPDLIVKKYFISLMEREKERQELFISAEEQYMIFKNVVKILIQLDSSSEKKQFIKEIIEDENKIILEKALKVYPGKPSIETLTDKLVNHALLDRKGSNDNSIGFINEFVFGTFIGDIMCETDSSEIEKTFSAYMVELGATAYRVQNKTNKKILWNKIESLNYKFPQNILFSFDITLKGELCRSVSECTFQSIEIYNVEFNNLNQVIASVFINCKFKNCKFLFNSFESVSFIQCYFDNCSVIASKYLDDNNDNSAIKCTQENCDIFYYNSVHYKADILDDNEKFQNTILTKIIDLEKKQQPHKLSILVNTYPKAERKRVRLIIDKLNREKIISVNGLDVYVEMNKLKEIQQWINK